MTKNSEMIQSLRRKINDIILSIQNQNHNLISQNIILFINELEMFYKNFDSENIMKLNHLLNEINAGLVNQDLILVSDVLEYEILPLLDKYGDVKE